jgi:hypothetical protein
VEGTSCASKCHCEIQWVSLQGAMLSKSVPNPKILSDVLRRASSPKTPECYRRTNDVYLFTFITYLLDEPSFPNSLSCVVGLRRHPTLPLCTLVASLQYFKMRSVELKQLPQSEASLAKPSKSQCEIHAL